MYKVSLSRRVLDTSEMAAIGLHRTRNLACVRIMRNAACLKHRSMKNSSISAVPMIDGF